jgi:hypothetical protein
MTVLLEKVLQDLKQLSVSEQDAIAELIKDELQWEQTLKANGNKLSKLAEEALREHKAGKTQKGDW